MDQDQDASASPGWDAINAALAPLYADQEPKHVGTIIRWMLGGQDPLDGISAYRREDPVPHWHYIGFGLTELYGKDSENAEFSGWGFELTFRLARDPADADAPMWPFSLMQNLARYVFQTGNILNPGEWMNANGPIALETDTKLCSLAFVADPELAPIDTPHGRVAFIQIVGLTLDEEAAGKAWNTQALLDVLLPHMPLWVTDLSRGSLLDRPEVREAVDAGTRRDGSSMGLLYMPALSWAARVEAGQSAVIAVRFGAGHVEQLVSALSARLPYGRELTLAAPDATIVFAPDDSSALSQADGQLHVQLSPAALEGLRTTLHPRVGIYHVPDLAGIVWEVEETRILDAAGQVVRTIG